MNTEKKQPGLRILMLIGTPKIAQKAGALFQEGNVPIHYQFHAKGTATSEVTDMLGLGNTNKKILLSIMPRVFADRMMDKMQRELNLARPNSGIAFSFPITGGSGMVVRKLKELSANDELLLREEVKDMPENKYTMIMTVANQGFSEEIMEAARSAGAFGGTVFHARQIVNEETMQFWGLRIQPEKEILIILAANENKLAIMQSISEKCGIRSEAKGIAFSIPIDRVIGLNE